MQTVVAVQRAALERSAQHAIDEKQAQLESMQLMLRESYESVQVMPRPLVRTLLQSGWAGADWRAFLCHALQYGSAESHGKLNAAFDIAAQLRALVQARHAAVVTQMACAVAVHTIERSGECCAHRSAYAAGEGRRDRAAHSCQCAAG